MLTETCNRPNQSVILRDSLFFVRGGGYIEKQVTIKKQHRLGKTEEGWVGGETVKLGEKGRMKTRVGR